MTDFGDRATCSDMSTSPRVFNSIKFGCRLRKVRGWSGLSASKLSELAGLSRGAVWALERGGGDPTAATISAVCRVLGLSADWLLWGAGNPPTDRAVRAAVVAQEEPEALAS